MSKTCYMCNLNATSVEHIPVQCFFLEGYRNQLITVPSCNIHNSKKSKDDEYVRNIFCLNYSNNELAHSKVFEKVYRSYERNPKLLMTTVKNPFGTSLPDGQKQLALK